VAGFLFAACVHSATNGVFYQLRSHAIKNLNGQFKAIFGVHGSVPTRGLVRTQRFVLGAALLHQLAEARS
jgi:hypothetical protein